MMRSHFLKFVMSNVITPFCLLVMMTQVASAQKQPRKFKPSPNAKAQDARAQQVQRGNQLIQQAYALTKRKEHSIGAYTQIIKTCEKATQLGVSHSNAAYAAKLMSWSHNRRGKLYSQAAAQLNNQQIVRRNQFEQQALSDFETAINLDDTRWNAYHNRGVSLAQMGKLKEAMSDFNKTLKLQPKYANAYYNRGQIYYEQDKYNQAITEYNTSLKYNAKDPEVYNSRGHANYRLGKFNTALKDYNRSITMNPNNSDAYCNRGDVYADLKQYNNAALDYRRAIRMSPNSGRAFQGGAWLMATCPDKRYRDTKKAIAAAQKALKLDGADDYRYLDTLAAAYANAGRYDDAKDSLQEAIRMAPKKETKVLQARLAIYEQKKPYRESNSRVARSATDTKKK